MYPPGLSSYCEVFNITPVVAWHHYNKAVKKFIYLRPVLDNLLWEGEIGCAKIWKLCDALEKKFKKKRIYVFLLEFF
jgi:hypothetical protein